MKLKKIAVLCTTLMLFILAVIPFAVSAKPGSNIITFDVSENFSSTSQTVGPLKIEHQWKLGGIIDPDHVRGILTCPEVYSYLRGKINLEITNVDNVTNQNYDSDWRLIASDTSVGKGLNGELWKGTKTCRGIYYEQSTAKTFYFTGR